MKIHLYFLCYNDERLLPFVLEHYSFCDKITVYDNSSTDKSVEVIDSYPNTQVVSYNGNGLDDILHMKMKNEIWKQSRGKCDFVIIGDLDECVYHPNIKEMLEELKKQGYTIIVPKGFDMITDEYPKKGEDIKKVVRRGRHNKMISKPCIFNPNEINEIDYSPGAHWCNPTGNVKIYQSEGDIKTLHYKFMTKEDYLARCEDTCKRVHRENVRRGFGALYPIEHYSRLFDEILKEAVEVI